MNCKWIIRSASLTFLRRKNEIRLNVESRNIKVKFYTLKSILDKRNEVMIR